MNLTLPPQAREARPASAAGGVRGLVRCFYTIVHDSHARIFREAHSLSEFGSAAFVGGRRKNTETCCSEPIATPCQRDLITACL